MPGTSTEANRLGCPDGDGDGWADVDDAFPFESTQWNDTDMDGYGDNAMGANPDACPSTAGTSANDRLGCADSDGDGYSDPDAGWTTAQGADEWPSDATQWVDADADGYGDNPAGTMGDACPGVTGGSSVDRYGCPDADGDGTGRRRQLDRPQRCRRLPKRRSRWRTAMATATTTPSMTPVPTLQARLHWTAKGAPTETATAGRTRTGCGPSLMARMPL